MIEGLKGAGRMMVFFSSGRRWMSLMQYADASWSIIQNGDTVGAWEAGEAGDCFRTFAEMTGVRKLLTGELVAALAERAMQPDSRLSPEGWSQPIPPESLN